MAILTMAQKPVEMTEQERFFRFFQHEVTGTCSYRQALNANADQCTSALQEQMQLLEDRGTSGGERADASDHCRAGIAKLSNEVKDAASYLPAYDQRTYSDASQRTEHS